MFRVSRPTDFVPEGLLECVRYFRDNGPIHFEYNQEDGVIVAHSTNFRYGSIVTSAVNNKDLEGNIKDAILTSFEIPSTYADKADIHRVGESREYVVA